MISPNRKGQYEAYIIIFWLAIRPKVLQRQQIRNTTQKKQQTTKQKKKVEFIAAKIIRSPLRIGCPLAL
jgi:hypothetical protein